MNHKKRPTPNLFVVGAMKSGTSSLHNYLGDHPNIYMSHRKEPNYFLERILLDKRKQYNIVRSETKYLDLFETAEGFAVIGESSTNYTKLPRFHCDLGKIAELTSNPRFIYVMRDPVERTISHYWHAVCWENERRGILAAVHEGAHYRAVSHYAMQLVPYFEAFGREHVLTLIYEEMIADPIHTMQSVYEWLGVDSSHKPSNAMMRYNPTPPVFRQDRGLPGIDALRRSWLWSVAGPHAPGWFRALAGSIAEKEVAVESADTEGTAQYLRSLQQEETKELSELLQRDFPKWRTLYGRKPTD